MTAFDKMYDERLMDIIINGVSNEGEKVRTVWKDGEPAYTKAVWVRSMEFKPEDGFPILTKKFVNPVSAFSEIEWIMIHASNEVAKARELGTNVWNEWENEDGNIGRAYGWQIENNTYRVDYDKVSQKSWGAMGRYYPPFPDENGKHVVDLNQLDYVIHQLIDNPSSRQTVTTMLSPKDKHLMELPPCVWTSHWQVLGGKLYLAVTARSSDTFLGFPFNVSQYAYLHRLVAHVTGYPLGDFTITTENTHLYDRHIPIASEFRNREEYKAPEFVMDKSVKSIREFKYGKNVELRNYKHSGKLQAPIAISPKELERLNKRSKDK